MSFSILFDGRCEGGFPLGLFKRCVERFCINVSLELLSKYFVLVFFSCRCAKFVSLFFVRLFLTRLNGLLTRTCRPGARVNGLKMALEARSPLNEYQKYELVLLCKLQSSLSPLVTRITATKTELQAIRSARATSF